MLRPPTLKEFSRYWKNTHAPVLKEIPGLRGYVQNHALEDLEGNEPRYDGFGELSFDSVEAMQEGLVSSEGKATLADIPNLYSPKSASEAPNGVGE